MKCRLRKLTLTHLLNDTSFHYFVRKNVFFSENIQYAYNFYEADLYVNACRGIFRTQLNSICCAASLQKSQKSFIVDVRLCSKCAFGVAFTVEKVNRMSIPTQRLPARS